MRRNLRTFLLATFAAFLLVPAAQAMAVGELKVNLAGTGTGEVNSSATAHPGEPPIECSNIAGEEKAVCENEMDETEPGFYQVWMQAAAGPGSEFTGWTVNKGSSLGCGSKECAVAAFEADAEVTASFKALPKENIVKVQGGGTGSGTVTSTGGTTNLNCTITAGEAEGECEAEVKKFGSLETTATPTGSSFTGWEYSGGGISECEENSPENPCTTFFTGEGAEGTLTASFEAEAANTVTVEGAGTGSGTVTSTGGITDLNCTIEEGVAEGECTAETGAFPEYELEVSATAEESSEQTDCAYAGGGFSGCEEFPDNGFWAVLFAGTGEEGTLTVTFQPRVPLNVSTSGTGSGSLKCAISGKSSEPCNPLGYGEGRDVTVTPSAAVGSEFVEWTGDCSGSGACEVTMDEERSVGAVFNEIPHHTLTATKSGSGQGWIHSSPAGINCGLACTTKAGSFEEGSVTLTAYGAQFAGWEVCPGVESGRECTVDLTEDKEAVAEFTVNHSITVTKTGTGNGWVHSSPAGINCGLACTTKTGFFEVSTVVLTAYGAQFDEWTECPGTVSGRECTIESSADESAEVQFTEPL